MLDGLSPKLWLGRDQESLHLFAQMLQWRAKKDYPIDVVCDLYDRADRERNARQTELFLELTNNIFQDTTPVPEELDPNGFFRNLDEQFQKIQAGFRKFIFERVRFPTLLLKMLARGQPSFVQVYEEKIGELSQDLFWTAAAGDMKATLDFFKPRLDESKMAWLLEKEALVEMIVMNPKEAAPFIMDQAPAVFHDQTFVVTVIKKNLDAIHAIPFQLRINPDFMLWALRAGAPLEVALPPLANASFSKMGFMLDAMAIKPEAITRAKSPLLDSKPFIEAVLQFHKGAVLLNGSVLQNALSQGLLSEEELLALVKENPAQFAKVASWAFAGKKGIYKYIVAQYPTILESLEDWAILGSFDNSHVYKLIDLVEEDLEFYKHVPDSIRFNEVFSEALKEELEAKPKFRKHILEHKFGPGAVYAGNQRMWP